MIGSSGEGQGEMPVHGTASWPSADLLLLVRCDPVPCKSESCPSIRVLILQVAMQFSSADVSILQHRFNELVLLS